VERIKSPIIQSEDFYPFGLSFNSYNRESSLQNRYLYNQGASKKKFNTERIFDLDLNVDESKYRTYDYITGRWWQVDPKGDAGGLESWSTYQYSFNNPILNSDPEGDVCLPCLAPAIPWIVEGGTLVVEAVTAYAGAKTTQLVLEKHGDTIIDAMGNASPYSTPAVTSAQQGGGVSSLNMNSQSSSQSQSQDQNQQQQQTQNPTYSTDRTL